MSEHEIVVNLPQLAAILEYLMSGPQHPFYAQARTIAEGFVEREHQRRIAAGQRMMQEQLAHISAEEWRAITD